MRSRPFRPRWYITVLSSAALALAAAAPAQADVTEPESPQRASLSHGNWRVTLHAATGGDSPIEIAVRHREGFLDAVLRPDLALDCPPAGGIAVGCRSVVSLPRAESLRGKGMILHAETPDPHHPPEVIAALHTGGARGSYAAVGFWRGQDGPWQQRTISSGSTAIATDGKGRIRVGESRWEALDWPAAAAFPLRTWRTLSPTRGKNGSWVVSSTKADHRSELKRANQELRRLARSKGRQARDGQRAVRAVIVAHQKGLGQTKTVRQSRAAYRRSYGARSLTRLDRGLRSVPAARR